MPPFPKNHIFDIFQEGLIRGSIRLPHDPVKAYAYVEHPTEGWRVYLRSCAFLHDASKPFSAKHFIVVKKTDASPSGNTWEPPKGQMEGKDLGQKGPIMKYLVENVKREVEEEAAIFHIKDLKFTGLVFQDREDSYPPNWFFQYVIFQGFVEPKELNAAWQHFEWIQEHPKAFARFKRDRREKDAIAWYHEGRTKMFGSWSPHIVPYYLKAMRSK